MTLTIKDVHAGSRLKCVDNSKYKCLDVGKEYRVSESHGTLVIQCIEGEHFLTGPNCLIGLVKMVHEG